MIECIDGRYLSVTLARAERLGYFTLAPQLFFATDAAGWTPLHLDGAKPVGDLTQFAEALWASVCDSTDDDHSQMAENQADAAGDLPF